MVLSLLTCAVLCGAAPLEAPRSSAVDPPGQVLAVAVPPGVVVAAAAPPDEGGLGAALGRFIGEEDLLFMFQAFVALGVAAGVGVVALVPANAAFLMLVFAALATQTPALLVAGPLVVLAVVVPAQALAAGIAVWLVGLTSKNFRARGYMPAWVAKLLKDRGGAPDSTAAGGVLGAPWLTGAGGFLIGAGLGLAAALVLTMPLVAGAAVLARAPPGNVSGILAVTFALMLGGALVVMLETLAAPPLAALAWHLSKEPVPVTPKRGE